MLLIIKLGGDMDFKSLLIGFLLAVLMFLLVGLGGLESGRYQIRHEDNSRGSVTIIDTSTGIAKKIYQGKILDTYKFNTDTE